MWRRWGRTFPPGISVAKGEAMNRAKIGRLSMSSVLVSLVNEQGSKCYYCQRGFIFAPEHPCRPTLDHKTPRWSGGTRARENLAAACDQCNQLKGPMDAATFIRTRHNRLWLEGARRQACIDAQAAAGAYRGPFTPDNAWLYAP